MGRYCLLQLKRIGKFLPGALLAMAILMGGLMAVFTVMVGADSQSPSNQKFQVAMVGTAEDTFVQMGLAALRTFDSSQLAMEIVEMDEQTAKAALEKGTIGAYIVVPENFVDEAMNGRILPLKFVSTVGAASVVSVFKEEVTEVVSTLVLESQRGVYGMQGAMKDNGIGGRGDKMNELAFICVEYVLVRDRTYSLQELGISDAMGLADYLLCGLSVLFMLLACLPFAPLMIRRDMALERMLSARGVGAVRQVLCQLGVYALGLALTVSLVGAVAFTRLPGFDLLGALPAVLIAAAFSFMLYALSGDLIGGVLLQFFSAVALCFVSGCMYPVFFFPESVQKLAAYLPTGAARDVLAGCLTGETNTRAMLLVLGFTALFTAVGVAARVRQVKEARV